MGEKGIGQINANLDDKLVERFRHVIYVKNGLKKGEFKKALRPRYKWRPYVFRAYFDTQLLMAESRGKIAHDFRTFFMGHTGSIESKYTTNKGILPDELIEEMRSAFKRSQEFLDLEVREEDPLLKQKEELKIAIEKAAPEKVQ